MGKLLEQRKRALDDINAGRTVKKIRDLESRVRELEEENARLKAAVEYAETIRVENIAYFEKQLATSQLRETQLREALENHSGNYKLSKAECKIINDLLYKPRDTSALDAYVAEKVKEASTQLLEKLEQLTRQRDLAVEALEDVKGCFDAAEFEGLSDRIHEANVEYGSLADLVMRRLSPALATVEHALSAIKESEGK